MDLSTWNRLKSKLKNKAIVRFVLFAIIFVLLIYLFTFREYLDTFVLLNVAFSALYNSYRSYFYLRNFKWAPFVVNLEAIISY